MRTGLIAYKVGMSSIALQDKGLTPVTLLYVNDLTVLENRTREKHGYVAVKLGLGDMKNLNRPEEGFFKKNNLQPKRFVKEFRVSEDCLIPVGQKITVEHFQEDQYIDASALSIGRGFAGGMRRHNFSGQPASHGVSLTHRQIGSTGQCQDPGRVWKGQKMPGHLGAQLSTIQTLQVVKIDAERGLIFVKGSVPGKNGCVVYLVDAKRKPMPKVTAKPSSDVEKTE